MSAWDAGATSDSLLKGNGYFSFEVPTATVNIVVGLNDEDLGTSYSEIDHGLQFARGTFRVIENGITLTPYVAYAEGDAFRVARIDGVVYYIRDAQDGDAFMGIPGTVVYTSTKASSGDVFLDAAMFTPGDSIYDASLTGLSGTSGYDSTDGLSVQLSTVGYGTYTLPVVFDQGGGVAIRLGVTGSGEGITYSHGSAAFNLSVAGTGFARSPVFRGAQGKVTLQLDVDAPVASKGVATLSGFHVSAGSGGAKGSAKLSLDVSADGGFDISAFSYGYAYVPEMFSLGRGRRPSDGAAQVQLLAVGGDRRFGSGAVEMSMHIEGFGHVDAVNYLNILMPMIAATESTAVFGEATDLLGAKDTAVASYNANAFDRAEASTSVKYRLAAAALDQLRTSVAAVTFQQSVQSISEVVTAIDRSVLQQAVSTLENLGISDAMSVTDIALVLDQLRGVASVETYYSSAVLLLLSAAVRDTLHQAEGVQVHDTAQLLDDVSHLAVSYAQLVDTMLAADSHTSTLGLLVIDRFEFDDSVQSKGHYLVESLLTGHATVIFKLGNELVTAVAMNVEGDKPISRYENYAFNSFAKIEGKYYGATDEGIFLLEGADDDGQAIQARLSTLYMDFGTSVQKRIKTAYIGYKADGQLVLKVRSIDQGRVKESWFAATPANAAGPSTARIGIGQGLRSTYWQFELANVDGADFELSTLELMPLTLSRRVF